MDVSSVSSSSELERLKALQQMEQEAAEARKGERPDGPPPFFAEVSGFGELMSAGMELSDEEAEEFREFGKSIADALRDGTFDAAKLAESAPDSVKELAEEQGVDLQSLLSEVQGTMSQIRNFAGQGPPPPPPGGEGEEEQQSLIDQIFGTDEEDEDTLTINIDDQDS